MRLVRIPYPQRFWIQKHLQRPYAWDLLCRRGQLRLLLSPPLRNIHLQLRTKDIKSTQDFGWIKGLLLLQEFASQTGPNPDQWGLVRGQRNRRKLKNALLRGKRTIYQPPETLRLTYQSTQNRTHLWQFYLERLKRYVHHKQLPFMLRRAHPRTISTSLADLTPLVSGTDALYLSEDYFDWENSVLSFQITARSRLDALYLSAFRLYLPIL